jgi:hypothetical protein
VPVRVAQAFFNTLYVVDRFPACKNAQCPLGLKKELK